GIHRAHTIEFPHLNRGEQVVHGKRIVRMTRQDPLEILDCGVVVEAVVVLESSLVQRVGWTERGRKRRVTRQTDLGKNQQRDCGQSGAMPEEEEKHAWSV